MRWRKRVRSSAEEDVHGRERNIIWHATRDQHEQCADEQTRVERNPSIDDVCGEAPERTPHQQTHLRGQRDSSDLRSRTTILLRNGWQGYGLTDNEELAGPSTKPEKGERKAMAVTHRVNRIAKAIEEEQFPLEGRHADLFDGLVDERHLLCEHRVDASDVENFLVHVDAGVARRLYAWRPRPRWRARWKLGLPT